MEQEVQSLLVRVHRHYSSPREKQWVLQLVFYSSEKGWRFTSQYRSSSAQKFSEEIQVQDPDDTSYLETHQIRGLVCHEHSKGQLFTYLHPLRSTGSSWGSLLGAKRTNVRFFLLAQHYRAGAQPYKVLESTTYLGVEWNLVTLQAPLSPAHIKSILATVTRIKLAQLITELITSLLWWLRTQEVFPEGQPISHDQGYAQVPGSSPKAQCWEHLDGSSCTGSVPEWRSLSWGLD